MNAHENTFRPEVRESSEPSSQVAVNVGAASPAAVDQVTILTAQPNKRTTKLWRANGTIDAYDAGWLFQVTPVPVSSIAQLSALLTSIESNPQALVIRGTLKAHALQDSPGYYRRLNANFDDAPLPWICLDVDGYMPPNGIDPVADPVRAVYAYIKDHLPKCFDGAAFHWQLSSSAGHPSKQRLLKAHLWFWLTAPRTCDELKAWAKSVGHAIDSSLYQRVQAHYTALPLFEQGCIDPVTRRSGYIDGGEVALEIPVDVLKRIRSDATSDDYDLPDPCLKPGVIGAFCRAYSVEQLVAGTLAKVFEWQGDSDRRLSWLNGNGDQGGAFVTNDRLHVVNKHNTDPCDNRATNMFDLVRVHCFGQHDKDAHPLALVEMSSRPSYRAMCDWASNLPEVVAELAKVKAAERDMEAEVIAAQGDPLSATIMQHPTQDGIALVFARRFEGNLRYAHQMGRWMYWDGQRWLPDDIGRAFEFARGVARFHNRDGNRNIASATFCTGVEKFAKGDPSLAMRGTEFDTDNYLLNTPAGTYDLREGKLRSHQQDDYLTKITAVGPVAAGGDRFRQFLLEITGGDGELVRFLQIALGACLSGAVESHWMMFWTGDGRNGKNTLGDLVMFCLGDYARKIPVATLMEKGHEAHPTELASLLGVRLATSSEVNDGSHWDESRINELTGDSHISARFMRGDFFEFPRTHKHLIYGNHRPQLRSVTEALKARLLIVPFKQCFTGREDPALPETLKAEAGAVLQWLIDGHAEWLRLGRRLPLCAAVIAETADYFSAQATVDMWVAECCELVALDDRPSCQLPKASDLYNSYNFWKKGRGEQPMSNARWSEAIRKRFSREKSDGYRYRGLRLISPFALPMGAAVR